MKKIGFIDYYLSEWHANNYPDWINDISNESGNDYKVAYAYAEKDISPRDNVTTDEWCSKFGAEKCTSIEEICEKSDYLFILAPDTPHKHLEYAEKVLKYKKPTYIDKTFAPNLTEAKAIFKIANKYNTPMFSTSALRCADELNQFDKPVYSVITTGGGKSLEVYIIHQIEMIERLMGIGAKKVMSLSNGKNASIYIDYGNGRNALINFSSSYSFSVNVEFDKDSIEPCCYKPISSTFFQNLMRQILKMFETGIPYVKEDQTMEVIAVRDACIKSQQNLFEWVDVVR
jgi:hypothetical protein